MGVMGVMGVKRVKHSAQTTKLQPIEIPQGIKREW
jgi:hypothetical protein